MTEIIPVEVDALPVKIVNDTPECAEFGVLTTYPLQGTESAIQILPYDAYRRKARIYINNPPAQSAQIGAFVWIGSRAQVQNNSGGRLQPGDNLVLENMRDYYVTADGTHPVDVIVLNERYSSERGEDIDEAVENSN